MWADMRRALVRMVKRTKQRTPCAVVMAVLQKGTQGMALVWEKGV